MTTFSSWEFLAVVTKKSILVLTGVVDPPLLILELGKLNKYPISRKELYYINILLQIVFNIAA